MDSFISNASFIGLKLEMLEIPDNRETSKSSSLQPPFMHFYCLLSLRKIDVINYFLKNTFLDFLKIPERLIFGIEGDIPTVEFGVGEQKSDPFISNFDDVFGVLNMPVYSVGIKKRVFIF